MNLNRFDHVNIVADEQRLEITKDFYVDILGLESGARPNMTSAGYWLYLGDQAVIHLSQRIGFVSSAGSIDHIAFKAERLSETIKRLDHCEIDYRIKAYSMDGVTQIFLHDPVGTKLELNFDELQDGIN